MRSEVNNHCTCQFSSSVEEKQTKKVPKKKFPLSIHLSVLSIRDTSSSSSTSPYPSLLTITDVMRYVYANLLTLALINGQHVYLTDPFTTTHAD